MACRERPTPSLVEVMGSIVIRGQGTDSSSPHLGGQDDYPKGRLNYQGHLVVYTCEPDIFEATYEPTDRG